MRLIFGFFVAVLLVLSIENGRTASISGVHNDKDKLGVEPTISNLKEDEESEAMLAFLETLSQEQLDLLDLEDDSLDEQQYEVIHRHKRSDNTAAAAAAAAVQDENTRREDDDMPLVRDRRKCGKKCQRIRRRVGNFFAKAMIPVLQTVQAIGHGFGRG